MSWHGVRTVATLELRQRLRTSRWPVVMGLWVALIGGVAALTWWAVHEQTQDRGTTLYDVVLFFVLGLGMLVVPSLTATSINGDREHGVLATLQTTLLTPGEIVLGKLAASWVIAVAFLVAAGPFLVWAWLAGGVPIGRMLLAVLVLVFVLAVICTLGLMFSALTARTISSAVLTYLSVAALVFGTLIAFFLSWTLVQTTESVQVRAVPESWYQEHQPGSGNETAEIGPPGPAMTQPPTTGPGAGEPSAADCVNVQREEQVFHTERVWWLLALNPFVVVADAAPSSKHLEYLGFEPLQMISDGARSARLGPEALTSRNECWPEVGMGSGYEEEQARARERLSVANPVWPFGFAFLAVIGVGATWVAIRRLRTPIRKLPRGTRIA